MTKRPASTKTTTWLLVAGVLCLAMLVAVIGPVYSFLDFAHSVKTFPNRHKEATEFIKGVYGYYREEGSWPDPRHVNQSGVPSLPSEWTYEWVQEEGGPTVLLLHGPYHMMIVYYFSPPSDGRIDNTWILSIEGDKKKFQADVIYR